MSAIFLSASVPLVGRGSYHETANPFLIQCAVRELVMAVIRQHKIVWGGHPAITPLLWSAAQAVGIEYTVAVELFQSRLFQKVLPAEKASISTGTRIVIRPPLTPISRWIPASSACLRTAGEASGRSTASRATGAGVAAGGVAAAGRVGRGGDS